MYAYNFTTSSEWIHSVQRKSMKLMHKYAWRTFEATLHDL